MTRAVGLVHAMAFPELDGVVLVGEALEVGRVLVGPFCCAGCQVNLDEVRHWVGPLVRFKYTGGKDRVLILSCKA